MRKYLIFGVIAVVFLGIGYGFGRWYTVIIYNPDYYVPQIIEQIARRIPSMSEKYPRIAMKDISHSNGKAEVLPQPHGALVGSDDEVELHGGETMRARLIERVGAHGAGDTAAECGRCNDIAAIGHMLPATAIIGA